MRPDRVDTPFLRGMYRAARNAESQEGKKEALEALETFGKTGALEKEGLTALDSYAKNVKDEYFEDKERYWETWKTNGRNFRDPALKEIEKEMGVSGELLTHQEKLKTELREATARAAVTAIAGGSFGPTGVVSGYLAYSNGTNWTGTSDRKAAEVVDTFKDFQTGESRMTTQGNKVEQVHRAELWRTLTGLLDHAAEEGQKGNPLPMTLQYYELTSSDMIGKVAKAAQSGSPVRLNLDPGRLSYPSKDKDGNSYFEVDDIPHKMRSIIQFTEIPDTDIGVSIFPAKQELDDPTDLMHRKVLRVGERVLMSGMNANMGSGENIDAGYVLEGPAARTFTENVNRDIAISKGVGTEEIWGEKHWEQFSSADLRVGQRGIGALLDVLVGPGPAGEGLPRPDSVTGYEELAQKAGHELQSLIDTPPEGYQAAVEGLVSGRGRVKLSDTGKEALKSAILKGIGATQSEKNLKALGELTTPAGEAIGKTRVDIADQPTEREVLALNAINEAEEFVYLPGFVVTRAISAAIVAKRDEALARGKELDIRIVADSGIYPDGGTPNSWGVNFLEENGIPVRWSKLTRTGSHDRKIHAKQLLTDKGEIAGSTNFSNKGLQENWETSAYVHFNPDDKEAIELRDASRAQFEDLWENETYDLSIRDLAAYRNRFSPKVGKEWAIDQDRNRQIKQVIGDLQAYEVESGRFIQEKLQVPEIAERYQSLLQDGFSEGDAALMAVEQSMSKGEYLKALQGLESHRKLDELKDTVSAWKERYGA